MGGGRGRGDAAGVRKGLVAATIGRTVAGGRGRDKDIAMDGGSGDKVIGVEEDGNTPAVPERVNTHFFFNFWIIRSRFVQTLKTDSFLFKATIIR
ncbi:hypothetical protein Hanom_Chr08g00747961 [Helianthus anomalus]